MGEVPTTVNEAVSVSDKLTDIGILILKNLMVKSAQAAQPWLAFPIISTLFNLIVSKLLSYPDKATKTVIAHAIIDHQTGAEADAQKKAKEEALAAIQTGDQNAINEANQKLDQAFGNLIHYDGS